MIDEAHTVGELIARLAHAHPDREAIVDERRRATYLDLERESSDLALRLLEWGVGKGTRVGLWQANSVDWVIGFVALARLGAVAVGLSTFFRERELAEVVRHADLHGLIADRTSIGVDRLEALQRALPTLADSGERRLRLPEAPYLRWIASACRDSDTDLPSWCTALDAPRTDMTLNHRLLREIEREVHPNDDALMIYTSGSTATPKGVPHCHATIAEKAIYLRDMFEITESTRSFTASPFFWVGGLTMSLLPVLAAGGTQFCAERFDAASFLRMVELERINRAHLYPHHIEALLAHPDIDRRDRSSLRDADARLLVEGVIRPRRADGLGVGLGMTETFGGYWWGVPDVLSTMADTPLRPGERRPPPLTQLAQGVDLKVVDRAGNVVGDGQRGEICVRGWGVTRALHKQPRSVAFDADGFLHTGDEGEYVVGRLYFRGRMNDMIKTSGANVAPAEVEAVLCSFPEVAEAYVVPVDDPVRGQVVAAAVVPAPGYRIEPAAIRERLRARLSVFKVPSWLVLFASEEIPWTPSHKVKKAELAAIVTERVRSRAQEATH